MEADPVGPGGAFNPGAGEVLLLVETLDGVEHSPGLEGAGHGEGRVAGICAYLQDEARPYHLHQHPQHLPLQMAAGHAGVIQMEVRGAPEGMEIRMLRLDVSLYVFFN